MRTWKPGQRGGVVAKDKLSHSNGDADIEKRQMDMLGAGEGQGMEVWREEHGTIHCHL